MGVSNIFTPYLSNRNRVRAHLELSQEDYDAFNSLPRDYKVAVEVTDLLSGEKFTVRRANCGSPECYCAAVIINPIRW